VRSHKTTHNGPQNTTQVIRSQKVKKTVAFLQTPSTISGLKLPYMVLGLISIFKIRISV